MTVSVLRIESDAAEVFETLSQRVEAYDWLTSFYDIDGDIVLLAAMNDVDRGRMELKDILRLFQVDLHQHLLRITVGSVEQLL